MSLPISTCIFSKFLIIFLIIYSHRDLKIFGNEEFILTLFNIQDNV